MKSDNTDTRLCVHNAGTRTRADVGIGPYTVTVKSCVFLRRIGNPPLRLQRLYAHNAATRAPGFGTNKAKSRDWVRPRRWVQRHAAR